MRIREGSQAKTGMAEEKETKGIDYQTWEFTGREYLEIAGISLGIAAAVNLLCYRAWWACIAVVPVGIVYFHTYRKNRIQRRKEELYDSFRDLIAYRIVVSIPRCHLKEGADRETEEIRYLYEIANVLPGFLEKRGFVPELAKGVKESTSPLLDDSVKPYYRDYITGKSSDGYRSLHITFYDNSAGCYVEMQIRTKEMDDEAEIGAANHIAYEKRQQNERARRDEIPEGECIYFDEAYERGMKLQQLQLAELDVNMFAAINNSLINDGCGLYRGRLILPYEHLSRFQNDLID